MYILGLSFYYHESAATLIKDGIVIAASAEERFSRKKHDSDFPKNAIAFCLQQAGITSQNLDYVVFYEKPFVKFLRHLQNSINFFPHSRTYFVESLKNSLTQKFWVKSKIADSLKISPEKILFVPHHLSHAAAAFYTSPFKSAAFLTIDGVGDNSTITWGAATNTKLIPKSQILFPHSIGLLYSTFTAFLGFEVNDGEFKVMGMAGYGKPRYKHLIKKLYHLDSNATFSLELDYFQFHLSSTSMYSAKFSKLFSHCDRFDLAASLQSCLADIILTIAKYVHSKTGLTNLIYSGGVALNSMVNSQLLQKTGFKQIYIFPAAGDDGGSVGAALYIYHHFLGKPRTKTISHVFWGTSFSNTQIKDFLTSHEISAKYMTDTTLFPYLAQKLSLNQVIGWFYGAAEFGPRALGHRSILANPHNPKMKDLVNSKIKFREEFRPFAPSILERSASDFFYLATPLLTPFMLATLKAKSKAKKIAPAVVHVDDTSRIQIVTPSRYYNLISAFNSLTHIPMLLNTSFNLKGEPIVNSPRDAYNTFRNSGLDILVLGNYVITK